DDVGADDIGGHEVGRELDAAEGERERLRQCAHEERFAQARHALKEHVAAGEEADERSLNDILMADDDVADLIHEALEGVAEGLALGADFGGRGGIVSADAAHERLLVGSGFDLFSRWFALSISSSLVL